MLMILITIPCYKALVVQETNFQGLKLCSLGNRWDFCHRVQQTHDFMLEVTPWNYRFGKTYYRPSFTNAILSKDGTYDCRNLSCKVSCFEEKWRFVEHMVWGGQYLPYIGHCVRVIGRDTVMCEQTSNVRVKMYEQTLNDPYWSFDGWPVPVITRWLDPDKEYSRDIPLWV